MQAQHVVATGQADVVLIGRAALRDPHFPTRAAVELGATDVPVPVPGQYERAYRGLSRR